MLAQVTRLFFAVGHGGLGTKLQSIIHVVIILIEDSTTTEDFETCNHHQDTDDIFLIRFEAQAKLAQQLLVCAPLGIHLEPINRVNTVSDNIIKINWIISPKERIVQCQMRRSLGQCRAI